MTEQYQMDEFSRLVEETKKKLKKHPNMSASDFFNGYLLLLLEEMRNETAEVRGDVDDILDNLDIPENPVLDSSEQTITRLASFVDVVLSRVGWINAQGTTEAFPIDLREAFADLGKQVAAAVARIHEARASMYEQDDEQQDVAGAQMPSPVVASSQPAATTEAANE
jgi:hypothetical protein